MVFEVSCEVSAGWWPGKIQCGTWFLSELRDSTMQTITT